MDNQSRYVSILKDSLWKKERILNNLLDMTKQQASYLAGHEFDVDVFSSMIDAKADMLEELDTVDIGFENTYDRIGAYLQTHKTEYESDIIEIQNCVREITRLSVSIKALEERNRVSLEKEFAKKNKEVRTYRKGAEMVNNYYQAMSGFGMPGQNQLDQKK